VSRVASLLVVAGVLAGCGSEEVTGGHTPVDAALFLGGVEVTGDLTLDAGQTTQVEVVFLDEHGEEIEGIEDGHFAALVFTPATLATTAYAPGRHFLIEVTSQATPGTGTVTIGYGHAEDDTDELTFGPINVVVQ
jgi:hypothetical protein